MRPPIGILLAVMRCAPRAVATGTWADEAAAGKLPQAFLATWGKHNGHPPALSENFHRFPAQGCYGAWCAFFAAQAGSSEGFTTMVTA